MTFGLVIVVLEEKWFLLIVLYRFRVDGTVSYRLELALKLMDFRVFFFRVIYSQ